VVRDSQKQWWAEHPGYQKQHRQQNPNWSRATVSVKDCGIGSVGLNFLSEQLSFGLKAFSVRGLAGGPQGAQA